MDTPRCLYVHVPYCERKCPYCAFNSYAGSHRDEAETYLDELLAELGALGHSGRPHDGYASHGSCAGTYSVGMRRAQFLLQEGEESGFCPCEREA